MALDAYRAVWTRLDEAFKDRETLTTDDPERVTGRYAHQTVDVLLRHVDAAGLREATALDYGCGTGRLARLIAPRCGWLICADIVPEIVDECRRRMRGNQTCGFLAVDGVSLAPDRAVDFVYSYAAIQYLNRAEEFWDTVALIDTLADSFCLHLNRQINETTDARAAIEATAIASGLLERPMDFFHATSCYRPSPETVKARYPGDRYVVEMHEPDVRGLEPFFYKLPSRAPLQRAQGRAS